MIYYNGYGYNFYYGQYGYYQDSPNDCYDCNGSSDVIIMIVIMLLCCCICAVLFSSLSNETEEFEYEEGVEVTTVVTVKHRGGNRHAIDPPPSQGHRY